MRELLKKRQQQAGAVMNWLRGTKRYVGSLLYMRGLHPKKYRSSYYAFFNNKSCQFEPKSCVMSCFAKSNMTPDEDRLPHVSFSFPVANFNYQAEPAGLHFKGTIYDIGGNVNTTGRFKTRTIDKKYRAIQMSNRFAKKEFKLTTKERPRPGCHGWECNSTRTHRFSSLHLVLLGLNEKRIVKSLNELKKLCMKPSSSSGPG